MRIPLSWLREFTELPEGARAEDLMADVVRVGLEEEDVHRPLDELTGPIVVGQVLSREPEEQKNGKTINWCSVRVVPEGQEQTLTGEGIDPSGVQGIVCGAHNFDVGDKVVVTLPGAVLPGDFRISPRKTYGHVSAGMMASARELGLGDDHDGILVFSDLGLDPEVGQDALPLLGFTDEAAEINVTPDRGYCFSIRGVAREYALATSTSFTDPASKATVTAPSEAEVETRIDDQAPIRGVQGCTRFVTRVVTDIDPEAITPSWMAERLRLAGMRPVSLPVDISNYVMWELGQPTHCYDRDKLTGGITVRRAAVGEKLVTLDEKERELNPEDLVIADESGAIGIAGVMGGASTEVSDETRTIVIEAANFDPVSTGRSRRRHKLPSEAAKRNERGVDWDMASVAAQRVVDLLVELAGGRDTGKGTDVGERPEPTVIQVPAHYPAERVGIEYTEEQVASALEGVGCELNRTDDGWDVTVPLWRPDMTIADDVVEEIARVVGYENIPSSIPVPPPGHGLTVAQRSRRRIGDAQAGAGMTEVLAYPFVSQAQNAAFGSADAHAEVEAVRLANPVSSEYGWMRLSLLPGLIEIARRNNGRGFRDLALFEGGLVFLPAEKQGPVELPAGGERPSADVLAELNATIPVQPWHIASVMVGKASRAVLGETERAWDWADAIDAARLVADTLGVELVVRQGSHHSFHPGRAARLETKDGQLVGWAGELHPDWLASQDLPERMVAMELDAEALINQMPDAVIAGPLTTFPAATQDVALTLAADIPAADVLETLREGAGELLEHIELFDDYRGKGIDEGQKSLAFGMRFRAADRTLTADEASEARQAAVQLAAEKYGAQLRG
ncbi:phenylalanine--tRNA ligase subunit beta [Pseudoglutamicibacter cumminsii]|uniref:phenylalanine--tRNA ligase subunit beta n=1 Tax=Pseudoglutamicibacter cumminsii TaxID=156979 RepID=UPI0025558056|nr:phenylalanine--tRNA ligase subunit beta [Pseudoglutamicibacter cumminsii]MDK7082738.1 phenylalanine--tRNA ligase subunit beta [Pseudoglutamicibacter cumminsii]